jgi:general secretion pathway protein G
VRPAAPARALRRGAAGFTLIELVVALAVLALLAQSAAALSSLAARRTQEQELRTALRQIRSALDEHKALADAGRIARAADASGYPRRLMDLVEGVPDLRSARGERIVLLRRLPRDPLADRSLPAEATWGLRSADSPWNDPRPGRDVFDVYSLHPGSGLDGRPYRSW